MSLNREKCLSAKFTASVWFDYYGLWKKTCSDCSVLVLADDKKCKQVHESYILWSISANRSPLILHTAPLIRRIDSPHTSLK